MSATETHAPSARQFIPQIGSGFPERLLCPHIYPVLMVAVRIVVDNPGSDEHAYWPIVHAEWNGWSPADFIFPSFVFLVGVSMVFSFAARLRRGESRRKIMYH